MTSKLDLLLCCLTLIIALSPSHAALAQIGGGRGERPAANRAPDDKARLAVPTEEPKQTIALTVWLLTISHSAVAEVDEQMGKLEDKANNLPAVVGTTDEVRDLIGRLKIAGILRKSREIRTLTLDGHPASAQSGADQPRVTATQRSEVGTMNTITMRPVGQLFARRHSSIPQASSKSPLNTTQVTSTSRTMCHSPYLPTRSR